MIFYVFHHEIFIQWPVLSSLYSIAVSYSEILRCQSLVLLATSDQVLMKPQ